MYVGGNTLKIVVRTSKDKCYNFRDIAVYL